MVRTRGLTKRFGATAALLDLDLDIERGEVFGYLGPNGAGKTTTLRLLMGLLRPSSGTAEVDGLDTWRQSPQVRRLVGYVPGEPVAYPGLTGRQHVNYLGHLRGAVVMTTAAALSERLELDLDRPAQDLSKGNRQKLALVLALMHRPALLLLDEPTSGLDPLAQREFQAIIREHTGAGGTVLLSSHLLAEVQRVADRVGILRTGQLVAIERLDRLRERSLHHVRVTFATPPARDLLAGVDGLRDVRLTNHSISCSAPESSLDAVVKALSRHTIVDLTCTEAELEETFLAYYDKEVDRVPQHVPEGPS